MATAQSMINVSVTQGDLERLAVRLARGGDVTAANRLRNLKAAVGGAAEASPQDWEAVDIQKVIDADSIVEGIKGRAVPGRFVRGCELARNSLVLVPLILTWLGIWQSTSAYDALLNIHPDESGQTFLYLWQQGFGGHLFLPWLFKLSTLAFTDFSFLLLILVLTFLVTRQYSLVNTQTEKEAEQLRESLAHTLGDATLCLAMARRQREEERKRQEAAQPTDLKQVSKYLFDFGQDFKKTTNQFLDELEAERKQRGDLKTFTDSLKQITTDLVVATKEMNTVNAKLLTAVGEVLTHVKSIPQLVIVATQAAGQLDIMVNSLAKLVADQDKWRQELQTVLGTGLNQLIANQQASTQELRNVLGQQLAEQQNAGQELRTLLNNMITQLISEQQQRAQELQNALLLKLGEISGQMNTSLSSFVAEQQRMGQRLLDAADTLNDTTNDLNLVVNSLQSATQEQIKAVNIVQAQQAAQAQLTNQMTFVAAEIRQILQAVHNLSPELRSMSVDMAKFVAALNNTPNVLKTEMLDHLKQYSSAAANINAGSKVLEYAAQHLEHVVAKLDGRLGP